MKQIYSWSRILFRSLLLFTITITSVKTRAQVPTTIANGICSALIADFNTTDNGFNSPSIYGSIFDSSFYYNASRGYWTDYLPPFRTTPPGFPRTMNIISPPFANTSPQGTFNVGFYYIVPNPVIDRFQIRIISVTQTPQGTVTNVEATSGVQSFSAWSTPQLYTDTGTALLNGFSGRICIRLVDPDILNAPNTLYRVEVSYIVNEPLFAVFDDLSIGTEQSPLPVDFIGIVAKRDNGDVNLRWDVGDEMNVREYQVEQSTTGGSFQVVGTVPATGKSVYSFTHLNAGKSTIFYRVKSMDIDGRYKYSGIVRLAGNAANSYGTKLTVYPVPAKTNLTVEHRKLSANAKISISTMEGRIIKIVVPTEGSSHTPVNITNFVPGMYILRLDDGLGSIETIKFVKE